MLVLLLIILLLLSVGSYPGYPYSRGRGYYRSGGFGVILLIRPIALLMGHV